MSRELSRHLVAVAIVLTLCCESVSRALLVSTTEADAAHHYQQHQRKHHHHQHQQQHQRHRSQIDRRNQTSLGHSASYALISGPASVNRGNDYGVRSVPQFHHQQQYHHQQHGQRAGHGSRQDTPPQHRRHARGGQHHHQPTGGTVPNGWRRTLVQETDTRRASAGSASSRPVNRMLTRHVISSGGSRGLNSTSKNVCTLHVSRKSLVNTSYQPCTDLASCFGMRPYSYSAKREVCCRGWETATTVSEGCFKPVCQTNCRNGGQCTAPDRCSCPKGFTGALCELDVNECKEHKPCDQICYNTEGSYYCACRDGFMLHSDRQSCRKIDETNDIATEARDMENDVDYDSLDTRLTKLEQMISREERRSFSEKQELNKKVQYAMDAVSVLKSQMARLTQRIYPSTEYGKRSL